MSRIGREASREAHEHAEETGAASGQRERLLRAALDQPGTARELAARAGTGEHDATTRCAELKRKGLLRELGLRANEGTGRKAVILGPTELTVPFLEGEVRPTVRPGRAALLEEVAAAARGLVANPGSFRARSRLARAVAGLDTMSARAAEVRAG